MLLNELAKDIYKNALEHGWYDDGDRNIGEVLSLVHSEVSEALEHWRNDHNIYKTWYRESDGKPDGFLYEISDVIIRCLDIFGRYDVDPEFYILNKHEFNKTRPYRHNKLA